LAAIQRAAAGGGIAGFAEIKRYLISGIFMDKTSGSVINLTSEAKMVNSVASSAAATAAWRLEPRLVSGGVAKAAARQSKASRAHRCAF